MEENRDFSEWPSDACMGCGWLQCSNCTIPGGICWKRLIAGTSVSVADLLVKLGIIQRIG